MRISGTTYEGQLLWLTRTLTWSTSALDAYNFNGAIKANALATIHRRNLLADREDRTEIGDSL